MKNYWLKRKKERDLRSQYNLNAEAEIATWDFNTALGDTIKEKYESLYIKVVEVSNVVHRKTLRSGHNWIVMSPEVASIFDHNCAGFAPNPSDRFVWGEEGF